MCTLVAPRGSSEAMFLLLQQSMEILRASPEAMFLLPRQPMEIQEALASILQVELDKMPLGRLRKELEI